MLTFLIATSFFYITEPVVNMREEASTSSPLVSQAYYSEAVGVLEEDSDWLKIQTKVDQSTGWIQKKQVPHQTQAVFLANAQVNRLAAHLYGEKDTEKGPILTLPYDARLKVVDASDDRWIKVTTVDGLNAYIQRGDIELQPHLLTRQEMCRLSLKFLDLPYHWGGRSSIGGFDCSGYVQMLYRQMGIYIPRDSKEQIRWEGFKPIALDDLSPGDLIFFGLSENQIRHVGMYLENGLFIHATVAENRPYIRISKLSSPEWNGERRFKYVAARALKGEE